MREDPALKDSTIIVMCITVCASIAFCLMIMRDCHLADSERWVEFEKSKYRESISNKSEVQK